MARTVFGASLADYGVDFNTGRPAALAEYPVWTLETGGALVTDLLDSDGNAQTVAVADDFGFIRFEGPDGWDEDLWLQGAASTPRLLIRPADVTVRLVAVEAAVEALQADLDDYLPKAGGTLTGALTLSDGSIAASRAWVAANTGGGSSGRLNALDYLAGNGGLESTTAISTLLAAWASTKKTLYWPGEGSYLLPANTFSVPANGLSMEGDFGATVISKSGNGWLLDVSGTDQNTRRGNFTMEKLTLYAGTTTGTLVRAYYTTMMAWHRVLLSGDAAGNGCGIDAVQWWDSELHKVDMENVGSYTDPGIRIRSSAAASGFGFSTDNSNALRFNALRVEGFHNGAIWIQEGHATGTNTHDISFNGVKCETHKSRGPFIVVDNASNNINFSQMYLFTGGFGSGYSTPFPMMNFAPYNSSTIRDTFIGTNGAYLSSGILLGGNGTALDRIDGEFVTGPSSGFFIQASGATKVSARAITSTHGTPLQTPSTWATVYP